MVSIGGNIYAGAASGVFVRQSEESTFAPLPTDASLNVEIIALARRPLVFNVQEYLVAAADDRVFLLKTDGSGSEEIAFAPGGITAIAAINTFLFIGTDQQVFSMEHGLGIRGVWSAVAGTENLTVTALAVNDSGSLLVGHSGGVELLDVLTGSRAADSWRAGDGELPDDDVRSIAVCGRRVVVAGQSGIAVVDDSTTLLGAGIGALPMNKNLAVDCNEAGILIGHEVGATWIAADLEHKDHYSSGRWMPSITWPWVDDYETYKLDNRVPAVALNDDDRWIGSHLGVSRIYLTERRLVDKEASFASMTDHFWRMGGFFTADSSVAEDPWNDLSSISLNDKDNDGLWTEMMIGAWCMAYAVTGNEAFYENARKGMDNMFKLMDYPAITFEAAGMARGFIARSIVSAEETELYNFKLEQAEKVEREDETYKDILRWNPVTVDGKDYLWKADTSSDEYAGHYFGMPVFYDLCAKTDEEREEVARYAGEAMRYVIDGGYKLIDLDGTRTMHGHWDPATISIAVDGLQECLSAGHDSMECISSYYGGGWLNSLEILGALLATYHMTGDETFYDSYEYLIQVHRYDEMAMANEDTYTITNPVVANHSDHELAMLAYTSIIRYEPNEERRRKWIESLEFLYESELPERNPWWAAICALSGCSDPATDVAGALRTLREMPDDNRKWRVDNRHRKDMEELDLDRHDDRQIDRVFSYDEIRTMWWNGNPYELINGGSGREWYSPTNFLLPYYMNLYAGLLKQEK